MFTPITHHERQISWKISPSLARKNIKSHISHWAKFERYTSITNHNNEQPACISDNHEPLITTANRAFAEPSLFSTKHSNSPTLAGLTRGIVRKEVLFVKPVDELGIRPPGRDHLNMSAARGWASAGQARVASSPRETTRVETVLTISGGSETPRKLNAVRMNVRREE